MSDILLILFQLFLLFCIASFYFWQIKKDEYFKDKKNLHIVALVVSLLIIKWLVTTILKM